MQDPEQRAWIAEPADMSAAFRQSLDSYVHVPSPEYHALDDIVRREQCMMFGRDLYYVQRPGAAKGKKSYLGAGFERFWSRHKVLLGKMPAAYQEYAEGHRGRITTKAMDEASYYEGIRVGFPCNLALDIEYYPHENEGGMPFEERLRLQLRLISRAFLLLYGIRDAQQRWRETWSDSSNQEKVSRHCVIHLPDNMIFAGWEHCGAFMRRCTCMALREYGDPEHNPLFVYDQNTRRDMQKKGRAPNDLMKTFCDYEVYTHGRLWRLTGNSKIFGYRPLFPFSRYHPGTHGDLPVSELLNHKHGWESVTREFVLDALVQCPPADTSQVRLLYVTEPNGTEARYGHRQPYRESGQYDVSPETIEDDGSLPARWQRAPVSRQRQTNAPGTAASKQTDLGYRMTGRDAERFGDAYKLPEDVPHYRVRMCVLLGQRLVQWLAAQTSTFAHVPDPRLIYLWPLDDLTFMYQPERRWCPFIEDDHQSNHVRWSISLLTVSAGERMMPYHIPAPDEHLPHPIMRPKCFSCDGEWRRMDVPFWDDELRALARAYMLEVREALELQEEREYLPTIEVMNFV